MIYDRNSIYIFRELIPDQLNLRKSEQTFQQCKYNNNILASIQFHIVYSKQERTWKKFWGKLFVSSGLHFKEKNNNNNINLSVYPSVCLSIPRVFYP